MVVCSCRGPSWQAAAARLLVACLLLGLTEVAGIQAERSRSAIAAERTANKSTGKATLAQRAQSVLAVAVSRTHETLHAWKHPLSGAAVVTTVALQLSPMPSCREIRRDRDVKRYDGYPYFTVLAGASQWCIYGAAAALASGDHSFFTMVAANGPGIFFGIFYVWSFLSIVDPKDERRSALRSYLWFGLALLVAEAAGVYAYRERTVYWFGLLGSVGSAQIALSPFKTLPEVLRTQSTRSWPLDLCIWNFIQSAATGGFGFANDDPWVWAPNVIGVIAAVVQLTLVAIFWSAKPAALTRRAYLKDKPLPKKDFIKLEGYGTVR
eukprot:TRINITY_DN101587_c0_g1_i1.p1 TRINITY_DN101587_c0_g1~~TRINITY_DN101587_c0_g1_i1.p1  ORF type:complete len:323 (-),score=59.61 TRINITY_DN101587_c0_g1_i1:192-1160(-)